MNISICYLLNNKGEQFSQIWMPTCDSFWVPNEIKSWNFQHMLHLWFREASQNLSSFRQLFFHSFKGGTKGKILKNFQNYVYIGFSAFFLWSPPWKLWKKSCLNELKLWEASRNYKWSIYWKFQLSISLGTQKESHVGIHKYLRKLFRFAPKLIHKWAWIVRSTWCTLQINRKSLNQN